MPRTKSSGKRISTIQETALVKKKIKGDFGKIDLAVPRDRNSSFAPTIIPMGETRFKGRGSNLLPQEEKMSALLGGLV